jgi:hypothetical protein
MKALSLLVAVVSLLYAPLTFGHIFRAAAGYPTGQLPVSVVVQDFNNDEIADLATANANDSNVSVLLGQANGTFGPANALAVGTGAKAIASGDFNADGDNDLVVTDGVQSVYISLGNGDGTFAPASRIALRTGTSGIALEDFNHDGKTDIAIAIYGPQNNSQGSVAVLVGNGDGTFAPAIYYSLDHNAERLVATDLNGDGQVDLAVALQHFSNPKKGLAVLLGNGEGTFQPAMTSASGDMSDVTAGDFNDDGRMDLALSPSYSSVVQVLLGNGDGTFATAVTYGSDASGTVVATDLDGDGKIDLLIGGGHTVTLLGRGDGTFGPPTVYAIGQQFAAPGFFNRDHVTDVVAGEFNGIGVAFGSRDGTLRAGRSYPAGYLANTIVAADFDQDGNPDLAVGGATTAPYIFLLLGDGAGGFAEAPGFGVQPAETIVTADFNRDGNLDVLSTSYDGGAFEVYLGHGDGTFESGHETKIAGGDLSPAIGDFNNDGIPDVAVARLLNGATTIFLGNGDGSFTRAGDLAEKNPQEPLVADFNGDGNADLGVASVSSGTYNVFLGEGDGTFQEAILADAPNAIYSAAADLNDDGLIDLVVASLGTKLFLGNGDGTFQPPRSLTAEYGPIHLADLNGDGKLDIVTTSDYSYIEVLGNLGHGAFRPPVSVLTGNEFVGDFVLQDFNGDARPDLAVTNISDAVSVLLNNSRHTKPDLQVATESLAGDREFTPSYSSIHSISGNKPFPIPEVVGQHLPSPATEGGEFYSSLTNPLF